MGTLSLSDYEEVRIQAPWGHIAGRWYGNRLERPILALHGWLDNLGTFNTLIPLLPYHLGVLCIDLPGHGRSSRLPPGMHYGVVDYAYIIPRVMKEYGWTKVSLMGHSLGGMVSFIYASMAPQTVDMLISLEGLLPMFGGPASFTDHVLSDVLGKQLEKHLIEDERQEEGQLVEPPLYTFAELQNLITLGSLNSVPRKFSQHLLHRSVTRSQLYPDKFYFSRDGRVKFYNHILLMDAGLAAEMASRIKMKPYLVIKGSLSPFVGSYCNEAISILSHNNPHFEFYEVAGTHHVHLHNAEECAKYIVPFLRHHRPVPLASWSLAGEEEQQLSQRDRRTFQERFFAWNKRRQRSKL